MEPTTLEPPVAESPIRGLARELQRQLATKRDLGVDTRRFNLALPTTAEEVADESRLVAVIDLPEGSEDFGITRHAHGQIAETLKLPFKTYERLLVKHPDLLENLAHGLLSREPTKRRVRVLDGKVRAFLSDRYRPRDNWDLLEHLLPVFNSFPGVVFKEASLTEKRLYVKAFLPSWEIPVTPRVGDVIRGGAIISNSEVGSGSLYIYPYTDRLICLNGMVHTDLGQRHVHLGRRIDIAEEAFEFYSDETLALDDAAFFAKCADTLRGVLNLSVFESIAAQMRDLSEITIPGSPVDAVSDLTKSQGLTDGEGESVLRHLIEGGDLSAWGFVNGITATARDLDDADRRTDLEIIAGRLVAAPEKWALVAA